VWLEMSLEELSVERRVVNDQTRLQTEWLMLLSVAAIALFGHRRKKGRRLRWWLGRSEWDRDGERYLGTLEQHSELGSSSRRRVNEDLSIMSRHNSFRD
jgi:hypothetical protein